MARKLRPLRRGVALTKTERKELGPVQLVVLGFNNLALKGDLLPELRRLSELEVIRLVDMVIVSKSENGDLVGLPASDPTHEDSGNRGAIAGALAGLDPGSDPDSFGERGTSSPSGEARMFVGGEDTTWAVADVIPPGSMAVVALIEHRWAIPLREAVAHTGGETLADAWIHPDDVVAYGIGAGVG